MSLKEDRAQPQGFYSGPVCQVTTEFSVTDAHAKGNRARPSRGSSHAEDSAKFPSHGMFPLTELHTTRAPTYVTHSTYHDPFRHIHTQAGEDEIVWSSEMDRAVKERISADFSRPRLTLPSCISHIPTYLLMRRRQALGSTEILPPRNGDSWTSSSSCDASEISFSSRSSFCSESDTSSLSGTSSCLLSTFSKDVANNLARLLDDPLYFWAITIVKIFRARRDPQGMLIVISDILSRHTGMMRSFAEQDSCEDFLSHVKDLVYNVASKLTEARDDDVPQSEPGSIEIQSGADFSEHYKAFTDAYTTAASIYKYMADRSVIYPLLRLIVAGSLFAFGTYIGDREVFTSESIKSTTKTIFGFFQTGTLGAFVQVFESISKLLTSWISSGTSIAQHMSNCNKVTHYFQHGSLLIKQLPEYSIKPVDLQRKFLDEVLEFNNYCVEHLGATHHGKNPWQLGKQIITDPTRLSWFKLTWSTLHTFYNIECGRSMRPQPFCVCFAAGSSVGKSTLQKYVISLILNHHLGVKPEDTDTYTYYWPTDNPQYANGATNGTLAVVIDDACNKRHELTKSTGGDPMVNVLLALLNIVPFTPDQAALEDKGNIHLAPRVVVISTNKPDLNLHLTYNEKAAIHRRIGPLVHVDVADEFATENKTLDAQKLAAWEEENPGKIPNAWTFRLEIRDADNRPFIQGKNIATKTTWFPEQGRMDTHSFLKWVHTHYAAHSELQDRILNSLNKPFDFESIVGPSPAKVAKADAEAQKADDPESSEADEQEPPPAQDADEDTASPSRVIQQSGGDVCKDASFLYNNGTFFHPPHPLGDDSFGREMPHFTSVNVNNTRPHSFMAPFFLFFSFIAMCCRFFLRCTRCAREVYDNSSVVRAARTIENGMAFCNNFVGGYNQRKKRALEWLEQNKRTIAIVMTLTSIGAIATYTIHNQIKKKKQKEQDFLDWYYCRGEYVNRLDDPPEDHYDRQVGKEKLHSEFFVATTTPNDEIPRWTAPPTAFDIDSTYGLTQKSNSAQGDSVVQAIADNIVSVTFECEKCSYSCVAIAIKKEFIILNAHSMPPFCHIRSSKPEWKKYTMRVHRAGFDNHGAGHKDVVVQSDCINGKRLPNRDLVGIILPRGPTRPFRDIAGYFPRKPKALWTSKFAYKDSILPPGTRLALARKHSEGVQVHAQGIVIPGPATISELTLTKLDKSCDIFSAEANACEKSRLCFAVKTSRVETKSGDCGSPYLAFHKGTVASAIVGLHLGQFSDDPAAKVVIPVYNTDFIDLFGAHFDLESPLSGLHENASPELKTQSGSTDRFGQDQMFTFQRGQDQLMIRVQNCPKLNPDTPWPKKTLEFMRDDLGIQVNEDSFAILGHNIGGGNLESDMAKSPLYDAIRAMDADGLPADMSCDKVVNNQSRAQRNDDAARAVGAIMAHDSHNQELQAELDEAAESFLASVLKFDKLGGGCVLSHIHPVPVDVAINGSHFLKEGTKLTCHKGLEPINMRTSPGHPYVGAYPEHIQEGIKPNGKFPWYECEYLPDGRPHYHMGPQLRESYERLLGHLQTDHLTRVMFVSAFKDEVKKPSKPTRLIMVGPQCLTIVVRQFLMTICRTMALNPFVFGAVVGLDATCVQWDQVRNFICGTKGQNHTFDGDYRDYDKSLFEEITNAVKWVVLSMCKLSGNYTSLDLFIVESILCCLLNPVVDVIGIVYWFRSLNTSGNSLTTQINCIANMLFIWLTWLRRMKKDLGAGFSTELAREMFDRLMHVLTYGDDHLVGITDPDMLNCRIMQQELSGLIVYTDAHKNTGDGIMPFTPHEQLIFLGRSMVRDSSGSFLPPLEFKRIVKTLLYYRKRSGYTYEQVLHDLYRGILQEVHFHGEEVYNIFYKRITKIMCEHYDVSQNDLERAFFTDTHGNLLTYDFFRTWWVEKKDYGFLRDPKYHMATHPDLERNQQLRDQYHALKAAHSKHTSVA